MTKVSLSDLLENKLCCELIIFSPQVYFLEQFPETCWWSYTDKTFLSNIN